MSTEQVYLSGETLTDDNINGLCQGNQSFADIGTQKTSEDILVVSSIHDTFDWLLQTFEKFNDLLKQYDPLSNFPFTGANALRAYTPSYAATTGSPISLSGITQINTMSFASDYRRIDLSSAQNQNTNYNGLFPGGTISWTTTNTANNPQGQQPGLTINQIHAMAAGQMHNPWFVPNMQQAQSTFTPSAPFSPNIGLTGQDSSMDGIRYTPGSLHTLYDPMAARASQFTWQSPADTSLAGLHQTTSQTESFSYTKPLFGQESLSPRSSLNSFESHLNSAIPSFTSLNEHVSTLNNPLNPSTSPNLAGLNGYTNILNPLSGPHISPDLTSTNWRTTTFEAALNNPWSTSDPYKLPEDIFAHIKFPKFTVAPEYDFRTPLYYADSEPSSQGQQTESARAYCDRLNAISEEKIRYGGAITLSIESPDIRRARAEARAKHMTEVMSALIKLSIAFKAYGIYLDRAYTHKALMMPLELLSHVLQNELVREALIKKARWEHHRSHPKPTTAGNAGGSGGVMAATIQAPLVLALPLTKVLRNLC